MRLPVGIGAGIVFQKGFQDFCERRVYRIAAVQGDRFILVEINLRRPAAARNVRSLSRPAYAELALQGIVSTVPLPTIPPTTFSKQARLGAVKGSDTSGLANEVCLARIAKLRPLINAAAEILAAPDPASRCNKIAASAGLHVTRARAQFFFLAAYGFEDSALLPAYWNCGPKPMSETPHEANDTEKRVTKKRIMKKRGPKVRNPEVTPPGWPFDPAWEEKILAGWKAFSKVGRPYKTVYSMTLHIQFGCVVDTSTRPGTIFHPKGESFPSINQFCNFVKSKIGKKAWEAAKLGTQTMRNRNTTSAYTVSQHLVNLLEEVQWDGQILDELPGDILDPSQPGKPIVRVVAVCGTCGGDVGIGYDYGAESKWAYLMALLSMAMKKSDFCALFGVETSDEDWPAYGVMAAVRGDRGPAIGRAVTEIVGDVLRIWQEWAASYDAVGKPNAEAAHYKKLKIDGRPQRPTKFRSPVEIIRDDLRKTAARFRTANMSHRLDPDQARRLPAGTPRTIWNDLEQRGLYAGQHISFEKIAPLTLPRHTVSILGDGVHLGGLRYLSDELKDSDLLDTAMGNPIRAEAYAMNMCTKFIWMHLNGELTRLTAVPVRLNAMEMTHSLTVEESFYYQQRMADSRRFAEQDELAVALYNEIERAKDHDAIEKARRQFPEHKSSGKAETANQHQRVLKRK